MAREHDPAALKSFRVLFESGTLGSRSDRELLELYTSSEKKTAEHAFAELVQRHGRMVMRVCRDVLSNPEDAEDAFQATFLVLARRGGSIRSTKPIGSWLHGVALRVAGNLRAGRARRRLLLERCARLAGEPESAGLDIDIPPLLHEELSRLPEAFRSPLILCYLEGVAEEDAARRLEVPIGTLAVGWREGEIASARRLVRRGVGLAAGFAALDAMGCACRDRSELLATVLRAILLRFNSRTIGRVEPCWSTRLLTLLNSFERGLLMTRIKFFSARRFSLRVCSQPARSSVPDRAWIDGITG